MLNLNSDIRQTFRFLARERILGLAILLTLGVSIGISGGLFTVVNAVLLAPLPYPNADRVVILWQQHQTSRSRFGASAANFLDWKRESGDIFESLAAVKQFEKREYTIGADSAPIRVKGVQFSPDVFAVLGVTPVLGRAFDATDSVPGRDSVVLLSRGIWEARFAADPNIVGRDIRLNDKTFRVIGVMPQQFTVPLVEAELFLPLSISTEELKDRRSGSFLIIGRLNDKTTKDQASQKLDLIATRLERQFPDTNKDLGIAIFLAKDQVLGDIRSPLLMMFAAAGLVVALAALNVAHMLLARGTSRQQEFVLRLCLGAPLWRILSQLVTEGLVLAVVSGVIAVVTGKAAVSFILGLFNDTIYFSLPRRAEIRLDYAVVTFIGVLCVLTAVLSNVATIAPVLKAHLTTVLRGARGSGGSRLRPVLLAGEVAVAVCLLVGAALLVRSFVALQHVDPGYSADGLLTAKLTLSESSYPKSSQQADFFQHLTAEVSRTPGVQEAAAVSFLPLSGLASVSTVKVIGGKPTEKLPPSFHHAVTPGYFRVMRIALLGGRDFDERDTSGAPQVAILSRTASRRYFGEDNPIGRFVQIDDSKCLVVGLVADVRNLRLDLAPRPQIYVPMHQNPLLAMTIVARTSGGPNNFAASLQSAAHKLDRSQPLTEVRSMRDVVDDSSARWRVSTSLMVGFSAVACLLAVGGVYTMTSYSIRQRTKELAIRLAIGAQPTAIVRMILRSLSVSAIAGAVVGIGLAALLARTFSSLLFGVKSDDASIFAMSSVGLTALVLITGAAAAVKAIKIKPVDALRQE